MWARSPPRWAGKLPYLKQPQGWAEQAPSPKPSFCSANCRSLPSGLGEGSGLHQTPVLIFLQLTSKVRGLLCSGLCWGNGNLVETVASPQISAGFSRPSKLRLALEGSPGRLGRAAAGPPRGQPSLKAEASPQDAQLTRSFVRSLHLASTDDHKGATAAGPAPPSGRPRVDPSPEGLLQASHRPPRGSGPLPPHCGGGETFAAVLAFHLSYMI